MSWETSIKGFKSYLQIERSLSDNSVQAYIRDVKKFANYAIPIELSELKVTRIDISDFLAQINQKNISSRSQARIISGIKAFYKYLRSIIINIKLPSVFTKGVLLTKISVT